MKFILLILTQLSLILCSGVSVHLTLISRIHPYLPEDVQTYPGYLLAGAFFPDSYYNCFRLNEAAEESHWPPFLLSSAKYYWQNYNKLNDSQNFEFLNRIKQVYLFNNNNKNGSTKDIQSQFKAFLYGIFTHQLADSTWHSIRMNNGLLKHFSALEFDEEIENAHGFLDTGGDFLLLEKLSSSEKSLSPDKKIKDFFTIPWEIPYKEMIDIYHKLGHNSVNELNMKSCMKRGETGLAVEIASYKLSAKPYIQESPYLNDILDDYYLGGLEEIETSIVRCLANFEEWLDNDGKSLNNVDPWSLCKSKIIKPSELSKKEKNELKFENLESKEGYFVSPMVSGGRFGNDIELGYFLGKENGLCAAIGSVYEEIDGTVYVIPLQGMGYKESNNYEKVKVSSTKSVSNINSSSRYGFKIKNYPIETVQRNVTSKIELMIITSPGTSTLTIVNQHNTLMTIQFPDLEQMGTVLEVADVNEDGILDLIIGSPYTGKDQSGEIVIINGQEILTKVLPLLSNYRNQINLSHKDFIKNIYLTIPKNLKLHNNFENFASNLFVNNDTMLVGVRSTSSILKYSFPLTNDSLPDLIFPPNSQPPIKYSNSVSSPRVTSKTSGQFGQGYVDSGISNEKSWTIISAHSESFDNCIKCGLLYLYINDDLANKIVIDHENFPKFNFESTKFGYSGVSSIINNSTIIQLSNPLLNSTGAIWKFDLTETLSSKESPIKINQLVTVGPEGYSGFGHPMKSYKDGEINRLIVGLSRFGYGELLDDEKKITGRVGIY